MSVSVKKQTMSSLIVFVPIPVLLWSSEVRRNFPYIGTFTRNCISVWPLGDNFNNWCFDTLIQTFVIPFLFFWWRYFMQILELFHNGYAIMQFRLYWGEWNNILFFRTLCNYPNYSIGRNSIRVIGAAWSVLQTYVRTC